MIITENKKWNKKKRKNKMQNLSNIKIEDGQQINDVWETFVKFL